MELAIESKRMRRARTYPFDIDERTHLIVDELSSELSSVIRVDPSNVLEERSVIGSVVDTFGVDDDLGELTSLGEASHDFVGDVRSKVNGKSESHVVSPYNVSEFFAAFDLVIRASQH